MKSKMSFDLFKQTMKSILSFKRNGEWDNDDWNDAYIEFKESISHWYEEYKKNKTPKELIVEWGTEFFQDAKEETHDYWIKIIPTKFPHPKTNR